MVFKVKYKNNQHNIYYGNQSIKTKQNDIFWLTKSPGSTDYLL